MHRYVFLKLVKQSLEIDDQLVARNIKSEGQDGSVIKKKKMLDDTSALRMLLFLGKHSGPTKQS